MWQTYEGGGGAAAPPDIFIRLSIVIMLTVLGMFLPNSVSLPLFFNENLLHKHYDCFSDISDMNSFRFFR